MDLVVLHDHIRGDRVVVLVPREEDVVAGPHFIAGRERDAPLWVRTRDCQRVPTKQYEHRADKSYQLTPLSSSAV